MKNIQLIENNLPDKEKYTEKLLFSIEVAFEPIKILLDLLEETEENNELRILVEVLYVRAISRLEKMFELVDEHVGVIELVGACNENCMKVDGGTLLSARVVGVDLEGTRDEA